MTPDGLMADGRVPEDPAGNAVPGQWARFDVTGKVPSVWAKLRGKLIERLHTVLDSTLDTKRGTTVKEEFRAFTSALLDAARAKLAKPGLEVQELEAKVEKLFAEKAHELALAEKVSEQAAALRLRNSINELRLDLGMTKALLVGEKGKEALLLGRQATQLLAFLKDLSSSLA